jgi:L-alanine-DL-glutamate epimerase-like enolase superfamily enzyme
MVRRLGELPVAADESARSSRDVARLAAERVVDVINLKIMKCGVAETLDMAMTARAHGLGLMIGGMVETRLAMTVSACLAAGLGGFAYVDLDTPWFMPEAPVRGGYRDAGPRLGLAHIEIGHGVAIEAR